MNKLIRALAFTAMLWIPQLVLAEKDSALTEAAKIGVLDWQRALMKTDVAKAYLEKLNDELSDENTKLQQLTKEIQNVDAKYKKEKDVMKESDVRDLQDERDEKVNAHRFLAKKVDKFQQDKLRDFVKKNSKYMETAILRIVDSEKLALVLRREAVPYFITSLDITNKVTVALNEEMAKDKK